MLAGVPVPDSKKPRTALELKHARESRANEALKMKDEQLKILSEQNAQVGTRGGRSSERKQVYSLPRHLLHLYHMLLALQLLASLDTVEEEANVIQMGKLAVEEENRTLRDQNFEIQSRARAADAQLKKVRYI
jgi:myosin protein heavy chain